MQFYGEVLKNSLSPSAAGDKISKMADRKFAYGELTNHANASNGALRSTNQEP